MSDETGGHENRHWPWVIGIPAAALVLSAIFNAFVTISTSHDTIAVQTHEALTQQRAPLYQAFLDASNTYAVADHDLVQACPPYPAGSCPAGLVSALQSARFTFQAAINSVYVYGSDQAWLAEQEVAAALPPSLGNVEGSLKPEPVNDAVFNGAYRDFQKVMCIEVGAASHHC